MLANVIVIGGYSALVAAAFVWLRGASRKGSSPMPRLGGVTAAAGVLLVGLALLWRTPIVAQQHVDAVARMPLQVASSEISCNRIGEALALLERASGGQISIEANGNLRVTRTAWGSVTGDPRLFLTQLASQVRRCRGASGGAGPILVNDKDSGDLIEQIEPSG